MAIYVDESTSNFVGVLGDENEDTGRFATGVAP